MEKRNIPGYTGYKPQHLEDNVPHMEVYTGDKKVSRIPGYQGYISGIKSENFFAQTYGRSTEASAVGNIPRGFDLPDKDRYVSVAQQSYQSQMPMRDRILKDFPFDEAPQSPKRQLKPQY